MLFTYNSEEVALVFKGVPITGLASGTFVTVSMEDDDWVWDNGSDGQVLRARKPNNVATATITLQQSALSNQVLSGFRALDRNTGAGVGTFLLKDLNGTTLVMAAVGFIQKPADITFSDETENREWPIILIDPIFNPGGNGETTASEGV